MTKQELIRWAKRVLARYGDRVAAILGIESVPDVQFEVDDDLERPAETSGNVIRLNLAWFESNPDDSGAVVHELVHAFQQVPGGTAPDKIIEGIADYVRFKLGLTYEGWTPDPIVETIDRLGPAGVQALSAQMSAGTFSSLQAGQGGGADSTVDGGAIGQAGQAIGGALTAATGGGGGGGGGGEIPFDLDALLGLLGGGSQREERDARNYFRNLILGLGIGMTSNLRQLIQQSVSRDYGADTFLFYLRQTPEYRSTFPGIFNPDGSMKMTEEQYLTNVEKYTSFAVEAGINLGPQRLAWLFQNDVSPDEFAVKATAVGRLNRDPQLFRAFAREVVQGGLGTRADVGRKGLLRFAAGLGNRAWYDLWQDAVTRNAAVDAGIAIRRADPDRRTTLPQKLLEQISGKGLSEEAASTGFQQLAELLLTALPLSKIQSFGLSKKQLTTAVFGGPNQAEVRQKLKRIFETEQAFFAPRASAALQESGRGGLELAGREERPQS